MKKGATHVDWVISMGIFIVFLLIVLIFLKPGVEPIEKEDTLLDILNIGFDNMTKYNIEKTPLIIIPINVENNGLYQIKLIGNFPFIGQDKNFALINKENLFLPFKIRPSLDQRDQIIFNATVQRNREDVFFILYSNDVDYRNFLSSNEILIDNEDEVQLLYDEDDIENNNISLQLGIGEKLRGLSAEKLEEVKDRCASEQNYNELKEEIGFPLGRNFILYTVNDTSVQYSGEDIDFVCNVAKPKRNVFVKEVKDFLLLIDGSAKGIIVNMRVLG